MMQTGVITGAISDMSDTQQARPVAHPHLLTGFSIAGVALRNRMVFQPHFTALGARDGLASDDLRAYHEERARGGVGLIVVESQAVHPSGKMSRRFISAWDRRAFPICGGSPMRCICTGQRSSAS